MNTFRSILLALLTIGLSVSFVAAQERSPARVSKKAASQSPPAANSPADSATYADEGAHEENDDAADAAAVPGKARPGSDPALELAEPRTYRLKLVVRVQSPPDSESRNVVVVAPIPMDWPEQRVRQIGDAKLTGGGKYKTTVKPSQCATMKYIIPRIAAGESAGVELLYEITRWRMEFHYPADELELAHSVPADVRDQFIRADAPGLEMKHPKIVNLARELEKQHAGDNAWDLIKGFWQWTRDHVDFKNGDFRGALFALEQKCGDCEEMSALFVSLCRLSGVYARSVWVEGHNYPEFYLLDKTGRGHWIPAQVLGPAWFGEMTEYRPIFQKGDRFFDPFHKHIVRYTPQTMKADGKVQPTFSVDHLILADSDINGPTYENSRE